eukprot:14558072-Alexandrium_andersonii.AAC.1
MPDDPSKHHVTSAYTQQANQLKGTSAPQRNSSPVNNQQQDQTNIQLNFTSTGGMLKAGR